MRITRVKEMKKMDQDAIKKYGIMLTKYWNNLNRKGSF